MKTIWIDLENSPHIPFFLPIKEELERRHFEVILTARDCFQVCELADLAGLKYKKVGHHYGKHRIAKVLGLSVRVLQLAPYIMRRKPFLSVCHGSRSLIVLSSLLGIPSITIMDYEHADQRFTGKIGSSRLKWVITPEVVPSANFEKGGIAKDHILHYPGIKEDVYVPFLQPDPALISLLGLDSAEVVVTLRPPATEAHYHNPESEKLLATVFELLRERSEIKTVLLPRTRKQEAEIRRAEPDLFAQGRVIVPEHAVNGLDLIWCSDVVISGGGTMNREAAALGVPVYSLFRGPLGSVDRFLADTGRLVLLQQEQDVRTKINFVRRPKRLPGSQHYSAALESIVNHICAIADGKVGSPHEEHVASVR